MGAEDLLDRGKDINNVEAITEYLTTHMRWRVALVMSSMSRIHELAADPAYDFPD